MISNKKILYHILFLFAFGLWACQPHIKTIPSPTPMPPDWFTDWLHRPVCRPPCWQGITPGVTTITDTAKILNRMPWITITFGPARPSPNFTQLWIEWKSNPPDRVFGRAYADDNGNPIQALLFKGVVSTSISEVIKPYGNPSHVFVDCFENRCPTKIIYMSSGMMIDLSLLEPDWRGFVTISPETKIEGIEFFPPGPDGFITAFRGYASLERLSQWQGYSKYPFK